MRRPNPTLNEQTFDLDEMFFSTTDQRGVVLDGNEVFRRISKYSREELIGSAHSIIRHPDMPKVVFKALWDTILAGKPICAYVKNLAKDGSFYWVFATVIPVGDEFLSIRLKATTPLKGVVEGLYKELLNVEKTSGVEASLKVVISTLNSLGIPDYNAFVLAAISAELSSRNDLHAQNMTLTTGSRDDLSRARESLNRIFDLVKGLSGHTKTISDKILKIRDVSKNIEFSALNATIEADRLGHEGRALAVIAQHISADAAHAKVSNNNINVLATGMLDKFGNSQLLTALTTLEMEMLSCFVARKAVEQEEMGEEGFQKNIHMLKTLIQETLKNARDLTRNLSDDLDRLALELDSTTKILMTLDFIQKNGSIEAARLIDSSGFAQLFKYILDLIKESKIIYVELSDLINKVINRDVRAAVSEYNNIAAMRRLF